MYCTRKAELSCELFHPCFSSLRQHISRSNYQTKIWRLSLASNPEIPSPDGHGWYFDERGELEIRWMDCRPAPDEILELVSCDCKKKCIESSCICIQLGFRFRQLILKASSLFFVYLNMDYHGSSLPICYFTYKC